MHLRAILLLPLLYWVLACSASSGASSAAAVTTDGGEAGTGNSITLTSGNFTLNPGDEKFYCYTMTLPRDIVVTGFTPHYGEATHHVFFVQTVAPEPNGFSECNELFKLTWQPLFVGGVDTTPLLLPQGTGIALSKGKQILLQLHLLNALTKPITSATGIELNLAADPTAPFTPAGIFGLTDETVMIPPNSAGFQQSMPCQTGIPLDVFAYFGHMHRIGTHLTLTRNGNETLVDDSWNFDVQPTSLRSMTISPTDQLKLTCTYTNTTSNPVVYGESTHNEMCALVFYYTKFIGISGCIQK